MELTLINRLKICLEVLTTTSKHNHPSFEKQLPTFINGYKAGRSDAVYIENERLMSAFQLVKNGKKISHLKFDEFKYFMDNEFDHNGEML